MWNEFGDVAATSVRWLMPRRRKVEGNGFPGAEPFDPRAARVMVPAVRLHGAFAYKPGEDG